MYNFIQNLANLFKKQIIIKKIKIEQDTKMMILMINRDKEKREENWIDNFNFGQKIVNNFLKICLNLKNHKEVKDFMEVLENIIVSFNQQKVV